jgi:hypothetical protein
MTERNPMHPTEEELHAFADGTLSASVRAPVAQHVEACAPCAALVDRVRTLLARADAAPRAIEPPADLWPAIARRIAAGSAAGRSPRWPHYGRLAAAAAVLVIATSLVTRAVLERERSGATAARTTVDGTPAESTGRTMTVADYDRLDRELAALLASHRKALRPETVAAVERNLSIIDQAIAEIRAALVEDPANRALHQLLESSYGQKVAMLRQLSRT